MPEGETPGASAVQSGESGEAAKNIFQLWIHDDNTVEQRMTLPHEF